MSLRRMKRWKKNRTKATKINKKIRVRLKTRTWMEKMMRKMKMTKRMTALRKRMKMMKMLKQTNLEGREKLHSKKSKRSLTELFVSRWARVVLKRQLARISKKVKMLVNANFGTNP